MDKILKLYLETTYDSPFESEVLKRGLNISMYIIHKEECIASGTINQFKNFCYVDWIINHNELYKMNSYLPQIKPDMNNDIIKWIIKRCRKQGINLVGPSNYFIPVK